MNKCPIFTHGYIQSSIIHIKMILFFTVQNSTQNRKYIALLAEISKPRCKKTDRNSWEKKNDEKIQLKPLLLSFVYLNLTVTNIKWIKKQKKKKLHEQFNNETKYIVAVETC